MAVPQPSQKACSTCGEVLVAGGNWPGYCVKLGHYCCVDCRRSKQRKHYHNNKESYRRRSSKWAKTSPKRKESNKRFKENNPDRIAFYGYKHNARRRGIDFSITLDEFKSFANKPCFYCGGTVKNTGNIGIDRVDNMKHYAMDNLVSCCSLCNWMKLNLSVETFISQCGKIVEHYNGST